jgi:hypothetical protein
MIAAVSLAGKRLSQRPPIGRIIRAKTGFIDVDGIPLRSGDSIPLQGGMLARSFWRAKRRKRLRTGTDDKIRFYRGLCTRLLRRVRRPQRIVVILDSK